MRKIVIHIFFVIFTSLIAKSLDAETTNSLVSKGKFLQAIKTQDEQKIKGQIVDAKIYVSTKKGYNNVVDLIIKRTKEIDGGFPKLSKIFYREKFSVWFEDKIHAVQFFDELNSEEELIYFYKEESANEFREKSGVAGRLLFSFDPIKAEIKQVKL